MRASRPLRSCTTLATGPTLSRRSYPSDRRAGPDEERVFVVESPLSELIDETIGLHRNPDFPGGTVIDERHRAFFATVKLSLEQAIAKIGQIEFAVINEDEKR